MCHDKNNCFQLFYHETLRKAILVDSGQFVWCIFIINFIIKKDDVNEGLLISGFPEQVKQAALLQLGAYLVKREKKPAQC